MALAPGDRVNAAVMRWTPFALLALGATFTVGIDTQQSLALREPLDTTVPDEIFGYTGAAQVLTEEERRVAGVSDYLARVYTPQTADTAGRPRWLQLYVGYYERQTQGQTIHSPKNCLPGAGWQALASRTVAVDVPDGSVTVNRYLLKRDNEQAVVLYWYQGRGRVEANEYVVKWDLLRDAALRRRTEEALVRIVVPVATTEDDAYGLAVRIARQLVPAVGRSLPT